MEIVGALATHYHPDHIGGDLFGHEIEGLAHLQDPWCCRRYGAQRLGYQDP
jgi:glyoxylase-like metal-dependent hydrolase (beta-lactamase superfamily II)